MNIAARIQGLAGPGSVMIDRKTHKMSAGLFDCQDAGRHALKGIKEPQRAWRVIAEKALSSRFVARATELTPMVGRGETLTKLISHWEKCIQGHGQAVVLSGEAGVGKSRIVHELVDILSIDQQFHSLEFQCSSYHDNTPLYPDVSQLKAGAGYKWGDSAQIKLSRLETLIRQSSDNMQRDMPAFIDLLSLPAGDKWPVADLKPGDRKEKII